MLTLKKGCLYSIVTTFSVAAVGVVTLWFIHRPLYKPPFLVHLIVDMHVNDEPVHIDRILKCSSFVAISGGLEQAFKRRETEYAVEVGALGKRLSDGSAVMMWTPYYCERRKEDQTGNMAPVGLPADRLPFMGWTPNADALETLEIYPSPTYFEKPSARIKKVRVRIEPAPENASASPPDKFEWFTQRKLIGEKRDQENSVRFIGFRMLTLSENEWRGKIPDFDSFISAFNKPAAFDNQAIYQAEQTPVEFTQAESHSAAFASGVFDRAYKAWPEIQQQRTESQKNVQVQRSASPTSFPLLQMRAAADEQPLVISRHVVIAANSDKLSYQVLYNEKVVGEWYENTSIKWEIGKNENSIICKKCFSFYDPNTKKLMRIYPVSYRGLPLERRF